MFGEVPICVIRPPSSEAKAMGIRNIDGETRDFRAIWKATGIIIASAPIFLMNAESTATIATRISSCTRGPRRSGEEAAQRNFHDAGPGYGGTDNQRAGDDDDDVIGKA